MWTYEEDPEMYLFDLEDNVSEIILGIKSHSVRSCWIQLVAAGFTYEDLNLLSSLVDNNNRMEERMLFLNIFGNATEYAKLLRRLRKWKQENQ